MILSKGEKFNFSKSIFFLTLMFLLLGAAFGVGLYTGDKRIGPYRFIKAVWTDVKLVLAEFEDFGLRGEPNQFLQPSRKNGDDVTVNKVPDDGNLVLLAGFFDGGNEVRLIRRDGTIIARWPASYTKHFPQATHLLDPPSSDDSVDLHGALIRPDGSVFFNYEYAGTVKLSRCNEVLWTLAHSTHHSIESAESGGYWIPGRQYLSGKALEELSPFYRAAAGKKVDDNLILKVTEDGIIANQKSVASILYQNGLEAIMTAGGNAFSRGGDEDRDPGLVHLNKIAELPSAFADAFQGFDAGDLLLSLRDYNLLLVVDPNSWRVKWHQMGPWLRQHDPEFDSDGTITVFNNNAYIVELDNGYKSNLSTPRVSNITRVNPSTGKSEIVYGGRPGQEFLTVVRGKHEITAEGGFFVTEFEAGRVFEVDEEGRLVWEYINRYDAERVSEITEARLYPKSYFTVANWDCEGSAAAK